MTIKLNTFISIFVIIFFSLRNFSSCDSNKDDVSIRGVKLLYHVSILNGDSILNFDTSYDVYYAGDLVIYKFFYVFDSSVNGNSLKRENRDFLFIFQEDSLFGYLYDPNPNRRLSEG